MMPEAHMRGLDLSDFLLELSTEIDRARQAAGLNQAQLARRADMTAESVGELLTGQRSPNLRTLVRLAVASGHTLVVKFERD